MTEKEVLIEILRTPIKLGNTSADLVSLLGLQTVKQLRKKFQIIADVEFCAVLQELIKFLYLSSYSQTSIFLPGTRLMDDLWHALILETTVYRKLCNQLKAGNFVDHSGMSFEEYLKVKTNEEINTEQLSWLASYRSNFGPITEIGFENLPLAKAIAMKIGGGMKEVNELAESLSQIAMYEQQDCGPFSFAEFIELVVTPNAAAIDREVDILKNCLNSLILGVSRSLDLSTDLPSNSDLEKLYGASTALAFSFWQHLSVVERLQSLTEWQGKMPDLWRSIVLGKRKCALATTHLGKPNGAGITASAGPRGYLINGEAPWVCGYGIFDLLLLGFECEDSIIFAFMDLNEVVENSSSELQEMVCLNGMATYSLKFKDKHIFTNQIVSKRRRDSTQGPRKTLFKIPELGIGKRALNETIKVVMNSEHPRHILVKGVLPQLQTKLDEIELARNSGVESDEMIVMRDDFNRTTIRLLSIAIGASSLSKNSLPARLQLETLLLDSVIHSHSALAMKIAMIGK